MELSRKEISLLAKAIEDPERFKELIINNFPKFDWKLTEIDGNKCEAIDEFMDIIRNSEGNKDLITKAIMLEGINLFRQRIQQAVEPILKEVTDLLCSKIDESLGFSKDSTVIKMQSEGKA